MLAMSRDSAEAWPAAKLILQLHCGEADICPEEIEIARQHFEQDTHRHQRERCTHYDGGGNRFAIAAVAVAFYVMMFFAVPGI